MLITVLHLRSLTAVGIFRTALEVGPWAPGNRRQPHSEGGINQAQPGLEASPHLPRTPQAHSPAVVEGTLTSLGRLISAKRRSGASSQRFR